MWNNFSNITSTTMHMTTTTSPLADVIPPYAAYLILFMAVFFFGTNYLPIKKYETGDGMFFQLSLTTAIWCVGLVVYWIRGFPEFYALPMLGGFLWTTGNVFTVTIIKCVGIGLGSLFWNTVLLILGWAVARFGWFGVKPEVPSNPTLNYIGVALALVSGIFYLFVKSETTEAAPIADEAGDENSYIVNASDVRPILSNDDAPPQADIEFFDRLSVTKRRILGTTLAIFAGVLYAFTFTPALYVQDNYPGASQNALDYVISLYSGIYMTSITYFAIYCAVKKNKPKIYPKVFLPACISGLMWGVANSSFFFANNSLTQSISFPIISSGPSVISSLCGIILYREIRGLRNFLILGVGFAIAIAGSVLSGISK